MDMMYSTVSLHCTHCQPKGAFHTAFSRLSFCHVLIDLRPLQLYRYVPFGLMLKQRQSATNLYYSWLHIFTRSPPLSLPVFDCTSPFTFHDWRMSDFFWVCLHVWMCMIDIGRLRRLLRRMVLGAIMILN